MSHKIPVAGPSISQLEIDYVADAVARGWYDDAGEYVTRFEEKFAAYTKRKYAVSLPSCTSAIHLALSALGIGDGDEVILPDATWIASCAPIYYVGAVPVFCDVDPDTWCISAQSAESVLSSRTKAIIAVDLYGGMADMAALQQIADRAGIVLIEDAAEAIGSRLCGKPAGSFGAISVFSFHGSKTLTTGEGGMLVTDDPEILARVSTLRDHGRPPGDRMFLNTEVAFKYKMSALQAALGLAQLERIEELVDGKRRIFNWYRNALKGSGLQLNAEPSSVFNSYWMSTALWPEHYEVDKWELMQRLADRGVMTRPFFSPLSSLPALTSARDSARARDENSVSYDLGRRGLNLPSALRLNETDVRTASSILLSELNI